MFWLRNTLLTVIVQKTAKMRINEKGRTGQGGARQGRTVNLILKVQMVEWRLYMIFKATVSYIGDALCKYILLHAGHQAGHVVF